MVKISITAVIAGFFTVFIHYSVRYGYGMLLPEMLPALEISKTEAGIIVMFFFIIYTLLAPITGVLSDILSFKILIPASVFLLGLGAFLLSTSSSMLQTGLFYSITAIGSAGCWAPVMVLIQRSVPEKRKGLAVSIVGTGTCLGIFLTGLLLPILVSNSSWRSGWTMLGITGLVIAFLSFILIANPKSHPSNDKTIYVELSWFFSKYKHIFKQTNFWLIAVAYLFVGFNLITIFTFLPVYASEELRVQYRISTWLISIIAASGIFGQLCLGYLSDKIGRRLIMIICGILLGLPCLGISLISSIWILFVLVACWGIGYGAVCAIYSASASDYFSRQFSGGIVGVWTAFLGLGSIVAPIICGYLIDLTKTYFWVFIVTMAVALLSAILILMVKKANTITEESEYLVETETPLMN